MDEGRVEFSSPAEHIAFGRMVGYLVWVTYDGRQFDSFDDSPTDTAIKAYLVNILDDELRLRPKSGGRPIISSTHTYTHTHALILLLMSVTTH